MDPWLDVGAWLSALFNFGGFIFLAGAVASLLPNRPDKLRATGLMICGFVTAWMFATWILSWHLLSAQWLAYLGQHGWQTLASSPIGQAVAGAIGQKAPPPPPEFNSWRVFLNPNLRLGIMAGAYYWIRVQWLLGTRAAEGEGKRMTMTTRVKPQE